MNDYPAMIVPVNHIEPVPPDPGLPGRQEGARHDPGLVCLGVAALPAVLRFRRRHPPRPARLRGPPSGPAAGSRNGTGCAPGRRTGRGRPGSSQNRRLTGCAAPCASSGPRFTSCSRRTSRYSSTRAARRPGRRAALEPPGARGARRSGAGGLGVPGDGVRDRPADAVLRQPRRCPLRAPDRLRHGDLVPLQGNNQRLLVGPGGRDGAQGPGLGYDFPTRRLLPITGMVAFYNEKVDTLVDGQLLDRPHTHFSRTDTGAS